MFLSLHIWLYWPYGRQQNALIAASMYFWSVSLVDQLSGKFHIFLVDQIFFGRPIFFWSTKNSQRLTKNSLRPDNFFLVDQKKMRKRPDNWSTKRLTKTTWTGLIFKSTKWCRFQFVYVEPSAVLDFDICIPIARAIPIKAYLPDDIFSQNRWVCPI